MAIEVTFKIRIDGSDSVKEISLDDQGLAQAFSQAQSEVKRRKAQVEISRLRTIAKGGQLPDDYYHTDCG